MNRIVLAFLVLFLSAGSVSAQVIDMRAFSRQRGFKAYQPQTQASRQARTQQIPQPQLRPAFADDEQIQQTEKTYDSVPRNQPEEQPKQLRQTGIKIFQEKDEDKVMNFNVENPEFKKLNKKQQQDLLNRITIE